MKIKKTNPLYWGKLDNISSIKFKNLDKLMKVKENFLSNSVAPFVGRFGYPNVNLGILTPPETRGDADILDDQLKWSRNKLDITQIVDHRSQLLNSRDKVMVNDKQNINKDINLSSHQKKLIQLAQEITLSKKTVDTEIFLKNKPNIKINTDPLLPPFAANANIKDANLTTNPRIPTKVEKFVDDDFKASDAIIKLSRQFDEHYLSKILSVGTLGYRRQRKLVPTRWSITATDDTIGKFHIEEIKKYRSIENYEFYFGNYLGNYYAILLIPDFWSYELFEIYAGEMEGKGEFMTDYENVRGRKDYASNTVGGYYACRLAITERLFERKRQASVFVLRFITDEYTTPLGVWVCREASRESIKSNPIRFSSQDLLFNFVKEKMQNKFGISIDKYIQMSKLLEFKNKQKKLWEF